MRSKTLFNFTSLIRLVLVLATLLQVTTSHVLAPRAGTDGAKLAATDKSKTSFYKVYKLNPFMVPSLANAKTFASNAYTATLKDVPISHYLAPDGRHIHSPHMVFALMTAKGTVIASVPLGTHQTTVKKFMDSDPVFQHILGGASVAAHAEHHALYWAIKELGLTTADLTPPARKPMFGAVYGLQHSDIEIKKGKAVPKAGVKAGPRSPCSISSSNPEQPCQNMLMRIGVETQ